MHDSTTREECSCKMASGILDQCKSRIDIFIGNIGNEKNIQVYQVIQKMK